MKSLLVLTIVLATFVAMPAYADHGHGTNISDNLTETDEWVTRQI